MKVRIEYEYDLNFTPPFFAKTLYNGVLIIGGGASFESAKARLITKILATTKTHPIPDPEEVEI